MNKSPNEMKKISINVHESNIRKFEKEFEKVAKKFKPFNIELKKVVSEPFMMDIGENIFHKVFKIDVYIPTIERQDSFLIGSIMSYYSSGNLINQVEIYFDNPYIKNKNELPPEFHTGVLSCDHCNVKRYRKINYIIADKNTGKIMRVGSSCVEKYFGIENLEKFFKAFDFTFKTLSVDFMDISAFDRELPVQYIKTKEYLTYLFELFDESIYGYITRSTAEKSLYDNKEKIKNNIDKLKYKGFTTSQYALKLMQGEFVLPISNNTVTMVDKFCNNITNLSEEKLNNNTDLGYLHRKISSGIVPINELNSITYLFHKFGYSSYKKNINKLSSISKYIGKVGEKVSLKIKIDDYYSVDSDYGTNYLYKSKDENGNEIVFFNGKDIIDLFGKYFKKNYTDIEIDTDNPKNTFLNKEIYITAKVKSHQEYQGVKKTSLFYVKADLKKEIEVEKEE